MFKADGEIFEDTHYDFEVLLKRLREQAFLNAGIKIVFSDLRDKENEKSEVLHYEGGIRQFVEHIHKTKGLESLSDKVIYVSGMQGDSFAEIAMQYNDSYNEVILSFANNIHTTDGGSHETGFKNALTKVINEYGKKFNLLKDGEKLLGDDVREGLTAIISVKLTECEFEGQTKGRLGNPEVKGRQRQRMREASRRRMMQDVPKADVVITNPTHLAVAIKYEPEVHKAPVVLAKGEDYLAQKIKEKARECHIEIVENKPLARMLYANVDIGAEIPPELYQAVAEVLAMVYNLKNR